MLDATRRLCLHSEPSCSCQSHCWAGRCPLQLGQSQLFSGTGRVRRSLLLGNSFCGTISAAFVQQPGGQGQRVAVDQGQKAADGSVQLPACQGGGPCCKWDAANSGSSKPTTTTTCKQGSSAARPAWRPDMGCALGKCSWAWGQAGPLDQPRAQTQQSGTPAMQGPGAAAAACPHRARGCGWRWPWG